MCSRLMYCLFPETWKESFKNVRTEDHYKSEFSDVGKFPRIFWTFLRVEKHHRFVEIHASRELNMLVRKSKKHYSFHDTNMGHFSLVI